MTKTETTKSGSFEIPDPLPYPKIWPLAERPELKEQFCYIIKPYKPGHSFIVKIEEDGYGGVVSDWAGNKLSPDKDGTYSSEVLNEYFHKIVNVMKYIKVEMAQYYFSESHELVDVRTHADKFVGPGMVRDIFANVCPIQEHISVDQLTDEKIAELDSAILKPSRFKTTVVDGIVIPLYAYVGAI